MTQDEIISEMMRLMDFPEERMTWNPTHLIVPPSMFKQALKIIFPHVILKRRRGVAGRAYTLKWRRKVTWVGNFTSTE